MAEPPTCDLATSAGPRSWYRAGMTQDQTPPQLTIKASDEAAQGRFANLAQVASSHDAFIVDFAFAQGQVGWLLSRIILSPSHAKRFHHALGESIARYEERFGRVDPAPQLQ